MVAAKPGILLVLGSKGGFGKLVMAHRQEGGTIPLASVRFPNKSATAGNSAIGRNICPIC
jgi:hypothetical protein